MLDSLADAVNAIGKAHFYEYMSKYLRHCLHYDNVIVVVFMGSTVPAILYKKAFGLDAFRYVEEQYLPAAYLLDPIYHFHLKRGKPGLYRLLDVAPDQFRRSRYFEWYYGRIGISDEISVVLTVGENVTITISMGMDDSTGHFFSAKAEDGLRQHESVIMAVLKAHWMASAVPQLGRAGTLPITDQLIHAMRLQHNVTLSKRQAEVALLILQGHSSISIGLHLHVSSQTVKVFRKQLYNKCQISSQAELFALMIPTLEWSSHRR